MTDKIKIFTISDHPLSPSGVGTQTKYMIEGMLKPENTNSSLLVALSSTKITNLKKLPNGATTGLYGQWMAMVIPTWFEP